MDLQNNVKTGKPHLKKLVVIKPQSVAFIELELELIQTKMTQKLMLRAEGECASVVFMQRDKLSYECFRVEPFSKIESPL
jgi:hypothetical protein